MNAEEARKVAWGMVKSRLSHELRSTLWERGLWPDLRQEVDLAVWQAERERLDARALSNLVARGVARLLREEGYIKRQKGFDPFVKNPALLTPRTSIQTAVLVEECGIKKCGSCRKYLPVEQFAFDARRGDRLTRKCRECQAEVNRRSYERRKVAA